jgi:hypothetical protein
MIGLRDEDIRAIVAETLAATLSDLHRLTFLKSAPMPAFDWGHWWLAFHEGAPIAFAGQVQSAYGRERGILLQGRRATGTMGQGVATAPDAAAEGRARGHGWALVILDTTDNLASANNFIRAGDRLYRRRYPLGVATHFISAEVHWMR